MTRKAEMIKISEEAKGYLKKISNAHKTERRIVLRSNIILLSSEGLLVKDIASKLNISRVTVIKWRSRFITNGIDGILRDKHRSGKPITYTNEFKEKVFNKLKETPPHGLGHWDCVSIAKELKTSKIAIWRLLSKERIYLNRQRTWCVSADPEFTIKAADIVGLYLNPPENAIVLSIDEKPGIQALSRAAGYVILNNNNQVRAIKNTYRRNGTQNLFAALEVLTGKIHGKTTKQKRRVEFLEFMDDLLKELPIKEGTEYHIILDNYCIHKNCNDWLKRHPYIHFHYTPTSASWLNMVEIWFNIMSRKVLRGASYDNVEKLKEAIEKYIKYYNEDAVPFIWRKREVRGSQIKDKLSNLCY
jgi:transposase